MLSCCFGMGFFNTEAQFESPSKSKPKKTNQRFTAPFCWGLLLRKGPMWHALSLHLYIFISIYIPYIYHIYTIYIPYIYHIYIPYIYHIYTYIIYMIYAYMWFLPEGIHWLPWCSHFLQNSPFTIPWKNPLDFRLHYSKLVLNTCFNRFFTSCCRIFAWTQNQIFCTLTFFEYVSLLCLFESPLAFEKTSSSK